MQIVEHRDQTKHPTNNSTIPLPPFQPISIINRPAKPLLLRANGEEFHTYNIIRVGEIPAQVKRFAREVLDPLLKGIDATIVPITNGALFFANDIIREINEAARVQVMCVSASSYEETKQAEEVTIREETIVRKKVEGRTVIIIDDILDTSNTVAEVIDRLKMHHPKQIITIFMLRKMIDMPIRFQPDYALFEIHGSSFVYGYGIDIAEKYRHLKFICDNNHDLYERDGTLRNTHG